MHKHIKNNLGLASMYIVFDGSSFIEEKKGTSHLVEHIICKNYDSLLPKLAQFDIESNAYTSTNEVVFYFKGLEESMHQFADILLHKILNGMTCSEEQFENEKKTVIQEYMDNFNDQLSGHYYNIMRTKLNNFGPIGEISDIENFTYNDCKKLVDEKFRIPSRIVTVSKKKLIKYTGEFAPSVNYDRPLIIADYNNPVQKVNKDAKTAIIGLFDATTPGQDDIKMSILLGCLNDGLESPLYKKIREERGLSYFSMLFGNDVGINNAIIFGACTTNERSQELIDVYNDFFSKVNFYIEEDRFEIIKQKMILNSKKSEILIYNNCGRYITNGRTGYVPEDIYPIKFSDIIDCSNNYFNSWKIYPF